MREREGGEEWRWGYLGYVEARKDEGLRLVMQVREGKRSRRGDRLRQEELKERRDEQW